VVDIPVARRVLRAVRVEGFDFRHSRTPVFSRVACGHRTSEARGITAMVPSCSDGLSNRVSPRSRASRPSRLPRCTRAFCVLQSLAATRAVTRVAERIKGERHVKLSDAALPFVSRHDLVVVQSGPCREYEVVCGAVDQTHADQAGDRVERVFGGDVAVGTVADKLIDRPRPDPGVCATPHDEPRWSWRRSARCCFGQGEAEARVSSRCC
jgi:hypothetical protein